MSRSSETSNGFRGDALLPFARAIDVAPEKWYFSPSLYSLKEENMSARGFFSLAACTIFLSSSAMSSSSLDMPVKRNISYPISLLLDDNAEKQSRPTEEFLQLAQQDVCCPGGYPWYRNSTNMCYGSYEDCHDTDGGGWSCRQVNAC